MSFHQSLRPMLLWMRFIGVFLDSPGRVSESSYRIWINCYGFLFFFANVFSNGLQITEIFFSETRMFDFSSPASLYSVAIGTLNLASSTIFSQLSLMSSAAAKWPRLLKVLCQMERQSFFQSRDYTKFRRIFIAGLASVTVFAGVIVAVMLTPVWMLDWPVYKKFYFSFPPFCLLFVFSGGTLFSCLGWMASNMLDILGQQVHRANNRPTSQEERDKCWIKRLDTWRHQHHVISQFVDEMNYCYGPLLLVLITSGFVQMIVLCYNTMLNVGSIDTFIYLIPNFLLVAIQFSFFLALIYVPHRISESAVYFSKQLRCIELGASLIENNYKIDLFAMNVLNSFAQNHSPWLFRSESSTRSNTDWNNADLFDYSLSVPISKLNKMEFRQASATAIIFIVKSFYALAIRKHLTFC